MSFIISVQPGYWLAAVFTRFGWTASHRRDIALVCKSLGGIVIFRYFDKPVVNGFETASESNSIGVCSGDPDRRIQQYMILV
jgi:hypothetical protein